MKGRRDKYFHLWHFCYLQLSKQISMMGTILANELCGQTIVVYIYKIKIIVVLFLWEQVVSLSQAGNSYSRGYITGVTPIPAQWHLTTAPPPPPPLCSHVYPALHEIDTIYQSSGCPWRMLSMCCKTDLSGCGHNKSDLYLVGSAGVPSVRFKSWCILYIQWPGHAKWI